MKMTISRIHIQQALEGLKKLTASHVPATVCIQANGRQVLLSTCVGEESAAYQVEDAEVESNGTSCVELNALHPYAKGRADDRITLESDGKVLTLSSMASGVEIAHPMPEVEEVPAPYEQPQAGRKTDERLLDVIRAALKVASRDDTRAILNGVCLDVSEKDHYVVATDGRRMSGIPLSPALERICRAAGSQIPALV